MINLFKRRNKESDAELETFRSIMEVPTTFEEGFSLSSLLGTLFVALIMVPGALYMELVAGMGLGGAAQWVTVLLFVEVAKRANAKLGRAQLFILFYMSGMIVGQSVYGTPLFQQFVVRSDAAVSYGISSLIPSWVAPANLSELPRTFLQKAWLPVIALMLFRAVFGQFDNMILGYGLFRITNDIEHLPFPMAPLGAQGVLAISEQVEGAAQSSGSSMRWRMFCVGAGVGMIFGLVYMALPTLTGAFFSKPLMVFPIPFADFTPYTQYILPAVATGLSLDLGQFIFGMVLPFYAMVGSFIGLVITFIANPVLYHFGQLPTWQRGDQTLETLFSNNIDFYFSFGIGISLSIAIYGLYTVGRLLFRAKKSHRSVDTKPSQRGDIPTKFIVITYLACMSAYTLVSGWLIDWHPGVMVVLLFFGLLYTPIISYVTAKLEGLAGQVVEIPFISELAFILSGYKGVAIWFLPIPKANYGAMTVFYKTTELLGCKFTSVWKSALVLSPIIFISMLLFSSFIWGMAEVPSANYPFTDQMWEFQAKNACLVYSSTLGEYSPFQDALSGAKVLIGLVVGGVSIFFFDFFAAPTMLLYGVVRGLGQTMPHSVIPSFIGALIGRYYFQRKYGHEWRKMIPVVGAGFGVGVGLVSILALGFVFLAKAVSTVSY
ncbi:MAG: peptide transporter [bacterium]